MFSKSNRHKIGASASKTTTAKAAPSIISANLHIVGNLKTDGEMHVEGNIEGGVTTYALSVGEKASISGEIVADNVEIYGAVSGTIRARKIHLAKTAKVIGDIWHEVLSIASGAYIEGQLKRAKMGVDEREISQPVKLTVAPVADQPAAKVQSAARAT
jgi:cytoskeletal protein CcmA (bactofilin family)